jgi:predicted dehydrogenase
MRKVQWGVLSTSKFAVERVIPAMQQSKYCDMVAIASRSKQAAQETAKALGIPEAFGSYEELLDSGSVEAVYNPLPNHMHVPWSIRALEAGKHVLCEKPIAMSGAEAETLLVAAKKRPRLKVMEAFMYRHHPQWQITRRIVREGGIGDLRTIQSFFSFWNVDPKNIRNIPEIGGGGLMDIGCYCISLSRFLFEREPLRVLGIMEFDPRLKTDNLASGILDFGSGTASFTCSTQITPFQSVSVFGTNGRLELEIPFSPPGSKTTGLWHKRGNDSDVSTFVTGDQYPKPEQVMFEPMDQYALQGDLFSMAIVNDTQVPTSLDDAVANMRVIDAFKESSKSAQWISL